MVCYQDFASIYDSLMADTPYDKWAEYIDMTLMRHFQKATKPIPATSKRNLRKPPFRIVRSSVTRLKPRVSCGTSQAKGGFRRFPKASDEVETKFISAEAGELESAAPIENESLLVLDLACGTGNMTLRLAKMGYDLIGVDSSEEMLAEANRKVFDENDENDENLKTLFLAQDMRELNLYGTVDAVVCVCDGLNYILDDQELLEVFKLVRLFLNPDGIFIFDMNTEYKFKEVLKNLTFEGEGKHGETYELTNSYDAETKINEYEVTFFAAPKARSGGDTSRAAPENVNRAFSEIHRQRAYSDICEKLTQAGFCTVAEYDGYSNNPSKPDSERIVYIATKGAGKSAAPSPHP